MKVLGLAVIVAVIFTEAASARCVLKREKMPDDAKCDGLVGYANGERVGFFNGHSGGKVTVGGKCMSLHAHGTVISSDKVNVNGRIWTLSEDCRSSR